MVDPLRSPTSDAAHLHLALTPGTDSALANGLMHVLIRDGLIDTDYIRERTEGFEQVRSLVTAFWPERVERITGVPEAQLVQAARMLGLAQSAMVLTGRGAEPQSNGVKNVLSLINIALALGKVGRPHSGYGCLTGQGNGQEGREHGQKADQLPEYRLISDPVAREHVAAVCGVPPEDLPGPGKSAYEMLDSLGEEGAVEALLVLGSNIVISAPTAEHVEQRLQALDILVVADFLLSETARLADVVLPTAQWAEEEGTMTNLKGRVIRRRAALAPAPGVSTDLDLICELAGRLGKGAHFACTRPEGVFVELGRASAGRAADYSGISYRKIEESHGGFWPCPSEDHPGTPRMFQDGFPTAKGKARFHPGGFLGPAEEPDEDYPLYLTTGRTLDHYQSGAQTRRVTQLAEMVPEAHVEMHATTASQHRLEDGDRVTLTTRRGSANFRVKITPGIRPDTLFTPFHWGGSQSANRLTNPALDPTSRMPEFKVCAVRIERVRQ